MKNLLSCFAMMLLIPTTLLSSCQQEEEKTPLPPAEAPVIRLLLEDLVAAHEGGDYAIEYVVEHPVEGQKPEVEAADAWIEDIQVDLTHIRFTVLANDENRDRSTKLTVSYSGAETTCEAQISQLRTAYRSDVFAMPSSASIPYRIPAIAVTSQGRLIAVADYRHSRQDIGVVHNGRIDLHYRISDDHGLTWGETQTLIEGQGADSPDFMNVGYGDPCIVADRESDRVLILSCAGNVSYPNGSRNNHQCIARFYSEDGGQTWSQPEDIAESIYSQFDEGNNGPVRSMFVASGRIYQSRFVKVNDYYRLYCAVLMRNVNGVSMNFVLYSDDFGGNWSVLGGVDRAPVSQTADEAKVEELPDGSLLISSRWDGGRYFNIFTFDDPIQATGSWGTKSFSGASNKGVVAEGNATNGELLVLPVVRNRDGEAMYLLLQSLPLGPGRANVGIYYQELATAEDYESPVAVARKWEGVYQVTRLGSAYSTMDFQKDHTIGFLWEESTYCTEGGGYTIAYDKFTVEALTNGAYSYREE